MPRLDELASLRGKNCFLTGGASGMGRATAELWARAGANVIIADMQQQGAMLAEDLCKNGHKVTFVHCDVTSYQSQVNAFKTAIAGTSTKSLDIVVMFAGIGSFGGRLSDQLKTIAPSFDDEPPFPPAGKVVEVNLLGTYYTTYLALHYLRLGHPPDKLPPETAVSSPQKSLIFVSSMTAYMDYPPHPLYSASKFGTRGLFRAIRDDTRQLGVRCSLIAPWYVDTSMTAGIKQTLRQLGDSKEQSIKWTGMDVVTNCLTRCAVDASTDGKVYALMPEGSIEIKDDLEHEFGGKETRLILEERHRRSGLLL